MMKMMVTERLQTPKKGQQKGQSKPLNTQESLQQMLKEREKKTNAGAGLKSFLAALKPKK